jgi:hypothetical protein
MRADRERVLEVEPDTGRPLTIQLKNGRIAYYQRREDDCQRAAVATLAQAHISEVPDPEIDRRLAAGEDPARIARDANAALQAWAAQYGLRIVQHADPPVDREAWIGIVPALDGGRFGSHTVVMSHDRLVFDPAANWPVPPGCKVASPSPIVAGVTLDRVEDAA